MKNVLQILGLCLVVSASTFAKADDEQPERYTFRPEHMQVVGQTAIVEGPIAAALRHFFPNQLQVFGRNGFVWLVCGVDGDPQCIIANKDYGFSYPENPTEEAPAINTGEITFTAAGSTFAGEAAAQVFDRMPAETVVPNRPDQKWLVIEAPEGRVAMNCNKPEGEEARCMIAIVAN